MVLHVNISVSGRHYQKLKNLVYALLESFKPDLSIFQSCRMWKLLFNKIDVATTNNKNHCSAIFIDSVN